MCQTWEKLIGTETDGKKLTETVRVIDEYRNNEHLINLTCQPEWIIQKMDEVIDEAVARPSPPNIGMYFLRFCNKHDLPALLKEANEHVAYLNSPNPEKKHDF